MSTTTAISKFPLKSGNHMNSASNSSRKLPPAAMKKRELSCVLLLEAS